MFDCITTVWAVQSTGGFASGFQVLGWEGPGEGFVPAATCLSAKGREGARRTANCEERVRHQGLGSGGHGRGNGNGNTFIREGTRRVAKGPQEANSQGTDKGCPYRRVRREAAAGGHLRWMEVAARTRAGTRPAPTGACGGRRPQRGGTCDGWKSQRVRGQAQGLPLQARAAGGGRKGGALAMDGSRSAYEGRHKACPYRRVRREAAAKGGTCDGWKSQRVRGQAQGVPLRGVDWAGGTRSGEALSVGYLPPMQTPGRRGML